MVAFAASPAPTTTAASAARTRLPLWLFFQAGSLRRSGAGAEAHWLLRAGAGRVEPPRSQGSATHRLQHAGAARKAWYVQKAGVVAGEVEGVMDAHSNWSRSCATEASRRLATGSPEVPTLEAFEATPDEILGDRLPAHRLGLSVAPAAALTPHLAPTLGIWCSVRDAVDFGAHAEAVAAEVSLQHAAAATGTRQEPDAGSPGRCRGRMGDLE